MSSWQLCAGLLACIFVAACAGGCSSTPVSSEPPNENVLITTDEFEGIILLPGDWVPTVEEVLVMEEQLGTYLPQQQQAFDSLQAPIEERLPTYKRQYWGVLENERRVIVVNLFCDASHSDWTEKAVIVLDGGDCYFRVRYDVKEETFSDLVVNGSA